MGYSNLHEDIVKVFNGKLANRDKQLNITLLDNKGEIQDAAIERAMKLAFPDITPRTMKRKKQGNQTPFSELSDRLLEYEYKNGSFSKHIKEWFVHQDVDNEEFLKWHKTACDTVIDFLKSQGYDETCVTYGKAQKVVNMTMKYLYCFPDSDKKEKYFEFCHIALDSFTLEWVKRKVLAGKGVGKIDSWSMLSDKEEKKGEYKRTEKYFYTYSKIVEMINEYYGKNKTSSDFEYKGLTPFQSEFYIWDEMQLHLAAEAFIFAWSNYDGEGLDNKDKGDIKKEPIDEKMDRIKNMLNINKS